MNTQREQENQCYAGHPLVEVYDEHRNAFLLRCPFCFQRRRQAEGNFKIDEFQKLELKRQVYKSGKYELRYDHRERDVINVDFQLINRGLLHLLLIRNKNPSVKFEDRKPKRVVYPDKVELGDYFKNGVKKISVMH